MNLVSLQVCVKSAPDINKYVNDLESGRRQCGPGRGRRSGRLDQSPLSSQADPPSICSPPDPSRTKAMRRTGGGRWERRGNEVGGGSGEMRLAVQTLAASKGNGGGSSRRESAFSFHQLGPRGQPLFSSHKPTAHCYTTPLSSTPVSGQKETSPLFCSGN
jgi:hypothetical protein